MGMADNKKGNIREKIIFEATRKKLTLCLAESCTGGMVAGALTEIPGASSVFLGGVVCYSNDAKVKVLGVGRDILVKHGAVSKECASAMAEGDRKLFCADIAISVTGIAGPDGSTQDKPVGLVWIAIESSWQKGVFQNIFSGGRARVRSMSVETALDILLKVIGRCPT